MQFHAVSIGEAVPRGNFDVVVHSVFDSAVNFHLAEEDRLLTLLISDHYDLPQGIRLSTQFIPFRSLRVGSDAASRGGILRFESIPLMVDLRAASVWKCCVPEIDLNPKSPVTEKVWSITWDLLNNEQRLRNADIIADELFQLTAGTALGRRIKEPVAQLVTSTMRLDLAASILAAERMIGLGPGVTPSGDDILIGFLAGLWSQAGKNRIRLNFILSFGEALMSIAGQTNQISRTYLYHATQGQFSSSLSTLAEKFKHGNEVEVAINNAMHVGHSSGMDSVTGLLIGISTLNMENSFTYRRLWQHHNA